MGNKKNHGTIKKNIPQQKICKIVGLSLYTLMQHQKSKSEFAKFKTKKIFKKVFCLLHNYKQSPLPKKKEKMYSRLLPPPLKKKKKKKKKLTTFSPPPFKKKKKKKKKS